jgi:hypothetical protein
LFRLCAGSGSGSELLADFLIAPELDNDFGFGSSSPGSKIGWCRVRGLKHIIIIIVKIEEVTLSVKQKLIIVTTVELA